MMMAREVSIEPRSLSGHTDPHDDLVLL